MDIDPRMGTRLRSLRRQAKLSQAKLAEMLGISASYLNLIEHNKRRLPAELMFRAAEALGIDVRTFGSGESASLYAEVMQALADPVLEDADVKGVDVADLVEAQPGLARAFVRMYRTWKGAEETARSLGGLTLDRAAVEGIDAGRLPSEEVSDLVQRRGNHFPALEQAAEAYWTFRGLTSASFFEGVKAILAEDHRVDVRIVSARDARGLIRRYDPTTRLLRLAETLPPRSRHFHLAHQLGLLALSDRFDAVADSDDLTTDESRRLCRMVLANYFAGALLMPYGAFHEAAESERYDIELLGHRFRTSFEQVCHRLTTLRRPGAEGVPFHLVKSDIAGNISKRFSASGIQFARFSGGCPRWNVNRCFMTPGRIRFQLSEMPDGKRYFCLARTVTRRHGGFHSPETLHAIGLGCLAEHAHRLVYADGLDLDRAELVPIGTNCRICERDTCEQRAFPSIRQPLRLDEHERRIAFYATVK